MAQTDPDLAAADEFLDSLMETSLYSMGAFFSDEHPDLVDEVDVSGDPDDLDTPGDLARWQAGGPR